MRLESQDFRQAMGFSNPTAVVEGSTVLAVSLRVDDADFASELQALEDESLAGQICQSAFELGVRVRKIANTSADALQLAEQVKRLDETFQRVTTASSASILKSVEVATDADTGLIAEAVKRETAKLGQVISRAFDEGDKASAISKIQLAVTESAQRIGNATTKSVQTLLDASIPDSPMALLQAGIRRDVVQPVTELLSSVNAVKEAIEVRLGVQAADEKGTHKGRKYEELAGAVLEVCASVTGDVLENVGDIEGCLPGSKAGDHVVTLASQNGGSIRIVFESKDRKLSLKKTVEELEDAAGNRSADVGVAVFSSQALAPCNTPFSRIADRRFVAVFDKDDQDALALRVAYQAARAEALTILQKSSIAEIDVDFVLARVAEARGQLELITQLEKGLNHAQGGIEASRSTARDLRDRLKNILDRLDQSMISAHRGAA